MSQFSFNISKVDGTTVGKSVSAQIIKIAQSYTTATYDVVKDKLIAVLKEEELVKLEVGLDNTGKVVPVYGWDTHAALTAATSTLFYGSYNHPFTQPRLHIRSAFGDDVMDCDLVDEDSAGYIHFTFDGDLKELAKADRRFSLVKVPDAPAQDNHNQWANLVLTMGALQNRYLGMGSFGKNVLKKHRYVDLLISNRPLHIWLGTQAEPYRDADYNATFIIQWLQTDLENAYQVANDRKAAARERQEDRRNFVAVNRQAIEGNLPKVPVNNDGTQEILVKIRGKKAKVNIFDYPACSFRFYSKALKSPSGGDHWDPNDPACVARWQGTEKVKGYAQKYDVFPIK